VRCCSVHDAFLLHILPHICQYTTVGDCHCAQLGVNAESSICFVPWLADECANSFSFVLLQA